MRSLLDHCVESPCNMVSRRVWDTGSFADLIWRRTGNIRLTFNCSHYSGKRPVPTSKSTSRHSCNSILMTARVAPSECLCNRNLNSSGLLTIVLSGNMSVKGTYSISNNTLSIARNREVYAFLVEEAKDLIYTLSISKCRPELKSVMVRQRLQYGI